MQSVSHPSSNAIKTMVNTVQQAYRAFQNLGRPVEHWDDWLVQIILCVKKLDNISKMLWEASLKTTKDFPTYKQMIEFLKTRTATTSDFAIVTSNNTPKKTKISNCTARIEVKSKPGSDLLCKLCKGPHILAHCSKFRNINIPRRRDFLQKRKCCFNCLKNRHSVQHCNSLYRCLLCKSKHHTLVHVNKDKMGSNLPKTELNFDKNSEPTGSESVSSNLMTLSSTTKDPMLLSTARVYVEGPNGNCLLIRVLLNTG